MINKKELHESVSKLTTIITNGFEDLSRKLNLLIKAYSNLYDKRFDMCVEQQKEIKTLTEMLNNVINIKFESNSDFETVVFQRYGQAPTIYYKGKKLDVNKTEEIEITMIDGESVIEVTRTHA